MFVPLILWIFQIGIGVFAFGIHLGLLSMGKPVSRIVRLQNDTLCECLGPATNYTVRLGLEYYSKQV